MAVDIAQRRREHVDLLESELPRLVEGLKAMGASLIVLFGSFPAGRRDLFTDLDILAVIESDIPFIQRLGETYQRLAPEVQADILVYTPEEFEEMKQRPFVRRALATGEVVYARPG
ncbi:MAG: nucleotidyltransferase domain-containing protein [Dehalococcoidia bacterium]|nr:nucleotidyltransferase domain-containing protein [Dehalococcoidia bacterium]